MKKPFLLTFVSIILMCGISFAQVPVIDFETVGNDWNYQLFGQGSSTFEIVANPDPSGINLSDSVACFIVAADAEGWAGVFTTDFPDLTLDATNAIVTVMVWKDVISDFNLKLEPPNVDQRGNQNSVTGQWEMLTFDYSAYIGETVATLTVLPDHVDTRTAGSITYYDNFTFGPVTENNTVEVNCRMGVAVAEGSFDLASDLLVMRGSFQSELGDPGGDWQGEMFALADSGTDTIFTITLDFPGAYVDSSFSFKFVIAPDGWEADPDRPFTVMAGAQVLPTYWYNRDSVYSVVDPVTNTINFTADIRGILGIGAGGAFDESQDTLEVRGLDWDGLGMDVTGDRDMVLENPFNPGIYITTLTVTSGGGVGEGDSTKFKFKARPDGRFTDGGWETTPDRWITYQADGSTITLPTIVPSIFPLFDAIQNDVDVTFNVDLSAPVNVYNGLPVDPSTIKFVGQRGSADFLGDWTTGGTWTAVDTTNGEFMKVMTHLGNNLYSRTVTVPAGTPGGQYAYKFGMDYPDADTVNMGTEWMDNEMPFGVNHSFFLIDGPPIVMNNVFGTQDPVTSIEKLENLMPAKFDLGQNYPNPFNPSTKIRFTVPEAGLVTLNVYNLLGQEVAVLVNEEQSSGVYEVTFNAEQFSSGIYFYTLVAENFTATRKMILMK